MVNRTLAQVTRYLDDPAIHDYAITQVNKHLTPETRVVIGHSLGSVVAYDTLRTRPSDQPVPLLVTPSSPRAVRDQPTPSTSAPGVSAAVRRWVNIAPPDDVVAARRELHAAFDRDRPHDALFEDTCNVHNGSTPHQINFYLTKQSCGAAVADARTNPTRSARTIGVRYSGSEVLRGDHRQSNAGRLRANPFLATGQQLFLSRCGNSRPGIALRRPF